MKEHETQPNLKRLGFHSFGERELFAVSAATTEGLPEKFSLPSRYFTCFLALDSAILTDVFISELALKLLSRC